MIMDRPVTFSPRFPRVSLSRYQAAKIMRPPDRTGEEQPSATGRTHNVRTMGRLTAASGVNAPLGTMQPEQFAREGPVEITSEGPPSP